MRYLPIRKLIAIPDNMLVDAITGSVAVEYEDGSRTVLKSPIANLDSALLKPMLDFPGIKIPKSLSTGNFLKEGAFTAGSHTGLYTHLLHVVVYSLPMDQRRAAIDRISERMYEVLSSISSNIMTRLYDKSFSINIIDFIDIQTVDEITEKMEKVREEMSNSAISEAYHTIDKVIDDDVRVRKNAVVKSARYGMVSRNQLLQCIGPRGYVTDIDFSIFPIPVTRSFTEGMGNLYNILVESRSAAKALYLSNDELSNSEYFSRRLQLALMNVKSAIIGDCGSKHTIAWNVRGPEYDSSGNLVYVGDIPNMLGKWFVNDKGELEMITKDHKHLIGKTINLRCVEGCALPDRSQVCTTCGGEILANVPANANLGHYSATTMASQSSQNILSTKHLDANAAGVAIRLTDADKKFFRTSKDKFSYVLHPTRKFAKLFVEVPMDSIPLIVELTNSDSLHRSNIFRISRLSVLVVKLVDKAGRVTEYAIDVAGKGKQVSFTNAFLKYIRDNGYDVGESSYIFDVTDWDLKQPIATLKKTEYNHSTHSSEISGLLSHKIGKQFDSGITQEGVLSGFYELVNSKLSVNLSFLEIIVYALSHYDVEHNDYRLGRGSSNPSIRDITTTINSRSWSTRLAYENLHNLVYLPSSFTPSKKPDHPLDVVIDPRRVYLGKLRNKA